MNYDAILFDFDGVLVDSEPIHYQCWSEILADFGLAIDWDTYAATCIGISDRVMLARMCEQCDRPLDVEDLYATYPRKRERFRALLEEALPFFEGASNFLASLKAQRLAVVTSSGRDEVEPALRKAGLLSHFDTLVCAGDVQKLKPAPDPYLRAARLLNAERPLVVEDSDAGEESARAAGFDVVRVTRSGDVPDAVRVAIEAATFQYKT